MGKSKYINKEYSFNYKGYRLQLVKNDNSLRYEVYQNRKLIYESTNIYWCKRVMATYVVYQLLGVMYDSDKEKSIYEGSGKKLFELLSPA